MFIARWTIDARFGKKDECVSYMKKWQQEVGKPVGWKEARMTSGSIGALESRIELEIKISSLAELEQAWGRFGDFPYHKQFGKDLEPNIVSGSNRWEIFRVLDP